MYLENLEACKKWSMPAGEAPHRVRKRFSLSASTRPLGALKLPSVLVLHGVARPTDGAGGRGRSGILG